MRKTHVLADMTNLSHLSEERLTLPHNRLNINMFMCPSIEINKIQRVWGSYRGLENPSLVHKILKKVSLCGIKHKKQYCNLNFLLSGVFY